MKRYIPPMLLLVLLILVTMAFAPATIAGDLACMDEAARTAEPTAKQVPPIPITARHWMPGDDEICDWSQVPPRWVCERDPWCWCFWVFDEPSGCYYLETLICA